MRLWSMLRKVDAKLSLIATISLKVSGHWSSCLSSIFARTMSSINVRMRAGVGLTRVREALSTESAMQMMPLSRVVGRSPG